MGVSQNGGDGFVLVFRGMPKGNNRLFREKAKIGSGSYMLDPESTFAVSGKHRSNDSAAFSGMLFPRLCVCVWAAHEF